MKLAPPRLFIGSTLLSSGQGGIACVARMTARAFIEAGAEVELLSFLDAVPVNISGLEARRAEGSRIRYAMMCHSAAWRNDYAIYDSVGMARAHPKFGRSRGKYAVWIHGIEVWNDLRRSRRRALEDCELALVNSRFTLDKYCEIHGPLPQARICQLATEEDAPPTSRPNFEGPPTVLTLGRIDSEQLYKGHHELIRAWPDVVSAVPGARLILAGGGSGLETIRSFARASGVAGSIELPGFVAEADVLALWRRAHVFAMPSRGEGFGLVYVEAMRWGLPVVASKHDAGREVNIDGVTGYNVDLNARGELSERLISLLQNPGAAAAMGAAGHDVWRNNYRYSAFAGRLQDAIEGLLPGEMRR